MLWVELKSDSIRTVVIDDTIAATISDSDSQPLEAMTVVQCLGDNVTPSMCCRTG
jgi:hypothetical protein